MQRGMIGAVRLDAIRVYGYAVGLDLRRSRLAD